MILQVSIIYKETKCGYGLLDSCFSYGFPRLPVHVEILLYNELLERLIDPYCQTSHSNRLLKAIIC